LISGRGYKKVNALKIKIRSPINIANQIPYGKGRYSLKYEATRLMENVYGCFKTILIVCRRIYNRKANGVRRKSGQDALSAMDIVEKVLSLEKFEDII
jgi:hypothetical protein